MLPVDIDALYESIDRLPASKAGPILAAVGLAKSAVKGTRCYESLPQSTQQDLKAQCSGSTSQDQTVDR